MNDQAALESWRPRYESWKETALPLLAGGNPKKAFATYPWFTTESDPFARLARPARETRFGLITTGGYSIEGQQDPVAGIPSFDGSKPEVREIPLDVDRSLLRIDHAGYDHRFAKEDINVNLPLDRIAELAKAGEIGSVAPISQVVMGLQPDVEPLIRELIPQLIATFESESVEAALLVPS